MLFVDTNDDGRADTLVRLWHAPSANMPPNNLRVPSVSAVPVVASLSMPLPRQDGASSGQGGEMLLPPPQQLQQQQPRDADVGVPSAERVRYDAGPSTMQAPPRRLDYH